MGMRLRKGPAPFAPVALLGGASIRLRAASAAEVDEAATRAGEYVGALFLGGQAADALAALAPQFDLKALAALAAQAQATTGAGEPLRVALNLKTSVERLVEWLMLVELAAVCHDGWKGVSDEDGGDIAVPDIGSLALLLQDQVLRERVSARIYSSVHEEISEGNASAASPNGAAAADRTIAGAAAPKA